MFLHIHYTGYLDTGSIFNLDVIITQLQFILRASIAVYVIVIPYPQGLYGIYCLNPRAKAINPIRLRGLTILKPTMATHLLYFSN